MKFLKPMPFRGRTAAIRSNRLTVRQKMYLIAFIVMCILMNPLVVHADILGTRWMDVYAEITENVQETNRILSNAFAFSMQSPYKVIEKLVGDPAGDVIKTTMTASQTASLAIATLLLMVDFFRKSVNFEWSSKWENVLLFLIKILVMKQVVQNSDVIIESIYSLFNYINVQVSGTLTTIDFLPCGGAVNYTWFDLNGTITSAMTKGWWQYWSDIGSGNLEYHYAISKEAVAMFYPNATYPDGLGGGDTFATATNYVIPIGIDDFDNPTTNTLIPTFRMLFNQVYFLVFKACAYLVFVIAAGRVFELCLYTVFAPLPLSTFASDTTHEVGKSFIKNYIAVVIQMAVIAAMFSVYVGICKTFNDDYGGSTGLPFLKIIALISLSTGVLKSSTWSKKICGIG